MKKILTILFVFLMMVVPVYADGVDSEQTTVDANIHSDGTTTITETWELYFDGSFSQFKREIPLNHNESMSDIHVLVNGRESVLLNHEDGRRPEGYYYVEKSSDLVTLYIYMDAFHESMTFTIQYKMDGAVHGYKDVAEFNYNMIGDDWDLEIENVSGTITFPTVASKDDIYVWGHGPAHGRVDITSNQSVSYACEYLDPYESLNIRLLLPTELFNIDKINHAYLEEIIAEEAGLAKEEANRQRNRLIKYIASSVAGVGGGVMGLIFVFISRRKLRKEIKPALAPEYYRDIPSDLTPNEVIDLMNHVGFDFPDKNKYSSTLLSLGLKGLIEFESYEEDGFFGAKEKTRMILNQDEEKLSQLKHHERVLYDFISAASLGNSVTFDDIDDFTSRRPKYSANKLEDFYESSKLLLEQNGYFDLRVPSGKLVAVSAVMVLLGVVAFAFLPLFAVPMAVCGVISLVLALTCSRYSQKGADEVALWEAFERFLKEFTLMDEKELPELVVWEEYLVYAVAMGIGEKVLKQLPEVYPNFYESDLYTRTYVRHFYYGRQPRMDMFNHIDHFSSHLDTAMHYEENSGGHGGSFSGGGGGFAGGGRSSGGGGGSFS